VPRRPATQEAPAKRGSSQVGNASTIATSLGSASATCLVPCPPWKWNTRDKRKAMTRSDGSGGARSSLCPSPIPADLTSDMAKTRMLARGWALAAGDASSNAQRRDNLPRGLGFKFRREVTCAEVTRASRRVTLTSRSKTDNKDRNHQGEPGDRSRPQQTRQRGQVVAPTQS
jgi:hypothetical protein